MSVPGNWFLQGQDLTGQVWMRRIVQVPLSRRGQRARLTFEGVDYIADIWLNGTFVGSHEGYFQPFSFDVTKLLKFGEDNLLVVRVDSPNEEYGRTCHCTSA